MRRASPDKPRESGAGMSLAATVGFAMLALTMVLVIGLLRQLGASDAAKGLMVLTGAVFVLVVAATYIPAIFLGFN